MDAENNKVLDKFSEARSINDYLTLVKADLLKHYNILLSTKDFVTADDVKNSYKGVKEIKKTFLQLFRQFNQQLTERKEIEDLSEGRHKRFEILYGKCEAFIKFKFKGSDVLLEELKLNFIVKFEHYLRKNLKIYRFDSYFMLSRFLLYFFLIDEWFLLGIVLNEKISICL